VHKPEAFEPTNVIVLIPLAPPTGEIPNENVLEFKVEQTEVIVKFPLTHELVAVEAPI
jgi:hypothetical protein